MKESGNTDETVLSLGADGAAVLGQCDANLLKIEKETEAEILSAAMKCISAVRKRKEKRWPASLNI